MIAMNRVLRYLVVLLIPVVLTSCLSFSGGDGTKVAVVGDSITNYSTPQVEAALADYNFAVKGIPGIDLKDGRTQLVQPAVAEDPDVLVIELGINSAREVWNSDDLPYLEGVLHDADAIDCVIWVTPTALQPSYYDHLGEGTIASRIEAFKSSLKKRLPKHPNQRLADFGVTQQAEWFDADHLHPSPVGKSAYASYVAEQVAAGC